MMTVRRTPLASCSLQDSARRWRARYFDGKMEKRWRMWYVWFKMQAFVVPFGSRSTSRWQY
jgi:hypothetical protein